MFSDLFPNFLNYVVFKSTFIFAIHLQIFEGNLQSFFNVLMENYGEALKVFVYDLHEYFELGIFQILQVLVRTAHSHVFELVFN